MVLIIRVERKFYVYILANRHRNVLYVGVTNNLKRRLFEHRNNVNKCFTSRYNVHDLMHYEVFERIILAIKREKQIKKWYRYQKDALISKSNPEWRDLSGEL
jgi:putative endonuclease